MQSSAKLPSTSRAELYAILADTDRLRILALCAQEELSVNELAEALKESQPQISRRAAVLREAELLRHRRDGTHIYMRVNESALQDAVVHDAVNEGRRLCELDGSMTRIARIIAKREFAGEQHFDEKINSAALQPTTPEHLAHLSALRDLLPKKHLAIDIGSGDGLSLDILAPLYEKVIAVERSRSQLAKLAERISSRGFPNVTLFAGSFDESELVQRSDTLGGADLVFIARALHHFARPLVALQQLYRLIKPGGELVILDYLRHEDETLRSEHADVWLGFAADELQAEIISAGFIDVKTASIPHAFHPTGPDAQLSWTSWTATKPTSLNTRRSNTNG